MSKSHTLVLIFILATSCLIIVGNASASVSKLSTPQVTVTYADHSYDIPAHTTTDPYTGVTVQIPVKHVENRTIQFTLKNPISMDTNELYYIIQMKGHFSENWTRIYKGWANSSGTEFTIWVFSTIGEPGRFYHAGDSFEGPSAGQVDFQVQAQTWGEVMAQGTATNPFGGSITTLFGESDWSSTQTITIGNSSIMSTTTPSPLSTTTYPSVSPSQNPSVTPNQPVSGELMFLGLDWVGAATVALLVVIAVLLVAVIVVLRKRGKS